MKRNFWKQYVRHVFVACTLLIGSLLFVSCEDDYIYDDREPEWLGESIYEYLKADGNFTYYVRLIDDVGYRSVLERTGSKTLFAAKDEAFESFFQNNPWGVSGYDQLSLSQKKLILNYGMLDNAYLIETLANYNGGGGLITGTAIRRNTSLSPFDTIPKMSGDDLPDSEWWNPYKSSGLYLLEGQEAKPLVHLLDRPLQNAGVSNEDFELITGVQRSSGDAHIFNHKVIQKDVTCKNGYVHVLETVMLPPDNMAEHLVNNENTTIFSGLLERFSAPYYSGELTDEYRQIHPEFNDSLFVKQYWTSNTLGGPNYYPDNTSITDDNLLLPYNPSWNTYERITGTSVAMQSDMGTMLVPNDAAMEGYFQSGSGEVLRHRFGTWENVPDNIVMKFLNRHMRESFLESVPSRFDKLADSQNIPIDISRDDIVNTYLAVNGLIYETNTVYPPNDYISVYAPVLFGGNTRIFDWVINKLDYTFYLNSLVSEFSFFVPTDEFFDGYIDPITIGKDIPGALKFWYNDETSNVNATVYTYDPVNETIGDSVNTITYGEPGTPTEYNDFLLNRLWDLLDSHVVVGNVESGEGYYLTKGGTILYADGSGMNLTVQGGGDIKRGTEANVHELYAQDNGNTYFLDKPLQAPLQSVYSVLSENAEFSEFFNLLTGFPSDSESAIFLRENNYYGIDFNIKFFNTYNYTVYVPTNDAVNAAIEEGLIHPWESREGIIGINDMEHEGERLQAIEQLERFLRYHFQDNAVFINPGKTYDVRYQTATIKQDEEETQFGTYKDKYYKIGIEGDGNNLLLSTENYGSAQVVKDNGLYNILTRDYIFDGNPQSYREIDGTGTGSAYDQTIITTSSSAVIHQIDNVLRFE